MYKIELSTEKAMSVRIYIDDVCNKNGNYVIKQHNLETGEHSIVNEDCSTITEASEFLEKMQNATAIKSKPRKEFTCELCSCEEFNEVHMSDPMCMCRHDKTYHGME
ncbi:hypothetical protein BH10ACI1_BH10ACI1_30980 [soil metagenome]